VNSLDRCGFRGHKVVLCYNIAKEVGDELTSRGYTVLAFGEDAQGNYIYKNGQPFSIVVERFFHLWAMLKDLKGLKHRYLIHTDVKDVIFQRNPSEWLEQNCGRYEIVAASESLKYEDEDWGRQNLADSFGPVIYEYHKNNLIVNAGTLSGKFDYMVDFFLEVYMVSVGGKTHNPDQAAVNVLLAQRSHDLNLKLATPADAWAAQLGTTNDPRKTHYIPKLINPEDGQTYINDDGLVCNFANEPFYLVHQYDRIPEWKAVIERKYND
jgi:hypothetical protein